MCIILIKGIISILNCKNQVIKEKKYFTGFSKVSSLGNKLNQESGPEPGRHIGTSSPIFTPFFFALPPNSPSQSLSFNPFPSFYKESTYPVPDTFIVIGGVVMDKTDKNFCLHGFALLAIDIIKINVYKILHGRSAMKKNKGGQGIGHNWAEVMVDREESIF